MAPIEQKPFPWWVSPACVALAGGCLALVGLCLYGLDNWFLLQNEYGYPDEDVTVWDWVGRVFLMAGVLGGVLGAIAALVGAMASFWAWMTD